MIRLSGSENKQTSRFRVEWPAANLLKSKIQFQNIKPHILPPYLPVWISVLVSDLKMFLGVSFQYTVSCQVLPHCSEDV